ncbi:LemA family protein [Colwellia asteriadis]|uniref:LemA family protein n=1 Tax=Colwellia asteriadis TaxID=517723 RepID=A0ABN1L4M1_9GAMM
MEILIILIPLTILFIVIVKIYNGIIRRHNAVKRAWANVITQQRQKNKIIPYLESSLNKYGDYEQALQKQITQLREAITNLSESDIDHSSLKTAQESTRALVGGIRVAVEAYPDLKASKLYIGFMKELTEQEENIGATVRIFNQNVESFNNGIQTFPNSLVNTILNQKKLINVFSDSEAEADFEYKLT